MDGRRVKVRYMHPGAKPTGGPWVPVRVHTHPISIPVPKKA